MEHFTRLPNEVCEHIIQYTITHDFKFITHETRHGIDKRILRLDFKIKSPYNNSCIEFNGNFKIVECTPKNIEQIIEKFVHKTEFETHNEEYYKVKLINGDLHINFCKESWYTDSLPTLKIPDVHQVIFDELIKIKKKAWTLSMS